MKSWKLVLAVEQIFQHVQESWLVAQIITNMYCESYCFVHTHDYGHVYLES